MPSPPPPPPPPTPVLKPTSLLASTAYISSLTAPLLHVTWRFSSCLTCFAQLKVIWVFCNLAELWGYTPQYNASQQGTLTLHSNSHRAVKADHISQHIIALCCRAAGVMLLSTTPPSKASSGRCCLRHAISSQNASDLWKTAGLGMTLSLGSCRYLILHQDSSSACLQGSLPRPCTSSAHICMTVSSVSLESCPACTSQGPHHFACWRWFLGLLLACLPGHYHLQS